ncbi:MAG: hypothetical protein IH588_04025 [Anaerolineales bacterium]|nr:hypothetical protein [Anaerolineales bacterium]
MEKINWESLNQIAIVISLIEGLFLLIQSTVWVWKRKSSIYLSIRHLFIKILILIITSIPILVFMFLNSFDDFINFWGFSFQVVLIFVAPGVVPVLMISKQEKGEFYSFWISFGMGILMGIFFWMYTNVNVIIDIFLFMACFGAFIFLGLIHSKISGKLKKLSIDYNLIQPD